MQAEARGVPAEVSALPRAVRRRSSLLLLVLLLLHTHTCAAGGSEALSLSCEARSLSF